MFLFLGNGGFLRPEKSSRLKGTRERNPGEEESTKGSQRITKVYPVERFKLSFYKRFSCTSTS